MSMLAPGLHDFGWEHYLSDPCPQPSLDSRGIRLLLEASPAHFAALHPKLTKWPDQLRLTQRDESLGSIVRCLVLNLGHEVAALPYDDWTTKLAQFKRKEAREDGKIPATRSMYDQASSIARRVPHLPGVSNATVVWKRSVISQSIHSIWCRERVDLVDGSSAVLVLIVKRAASDIEIAKAVADNRLDLKAAWALDGLYSLLARGSARMPEVRICVIETEPPYLVIVKPLSSGWLDDARERIKTAVQGFVAGLATKQWPYISSPRALQQPQPLIVR